MGIYISYEKKKERKKDFLRLAAGILLILLGLGLQRFSVRSTGPALEALKQDVQNGVPVQAAVEAFCGEVFRAEP